MSTTDPQDDTKSPAPPPTGSAREVLDLLAQGVPMALLADLADPAGPASPVILEEEGAPDEAWWVPDYPPADEPARSEEEADDGGEPDGDA